MTAIAQSPPLVKGIPSLPDEVLLAKRGLPWAYTVLPSQTPIPLTRRNPSIAERKVIEQARTLLANRQAKAIALIDGPNIVYVDYKPSATEGSLLYGASISKTVTAMAIGRAICADKLKLSDRASDIIPELEKKALGNATVHDLLRMASGAAKPHNEGNPYSGNILTPQNSKDWSTGTLDLVDLIAEDRVARAERGVFSDYRPGEVFAYKNTDPMVLGIMLNRVTGMSFAKWVQQTIFDPMGASGSGWISQNRKQQALADSGVRLLMEDWIRFAWWVKQASQQSDCFGNYVREASRTQISNGHSRTDRTSGSLFAGYGYLTWTDNEIAPKTFWAAGYGGQRIGWSYDSNRMVVAFSNLEDWTAELYGLFRDWKNVGP
jgi:CubicO group peptidase (beta-lactamase class C family)